MRLCNLTDAELQQHATNHAKVATWLGSDGAVRTTMAGIAAAIGELIDRRAAMANDLTEKSFAYEHAAGLIDSHTVSHTDEDGETWHDLTHTSAGVDLTDEIAYLEARHLLYRDPASPNRVCILDEGESLEERQSEAA